MTSAEHFDLDSLLEVFSQAVHETFNCVVVILFVTGVVQVSWAFVKVLDAFNGEQWT